MRRPALALALCLPAVTLADDDPAVRALQDAVSHERAERLLALARETVACVASGREEPRPAPGGSIGCGLFVTLVGPRGVRGCFGDLDGGSPSLEEAVVEAAHGAATRDTRFLPVRPDEALRLTVIVSLTLPAEPVADWRTVDPDRFGLLVQSDARSAVLLPGEARTASWEVDETLRKAGLRRGDPITIYRFRSITLISRGVR